MTCLPWLDALTTGLPQPVDSSEKGPESLSSSIVRSCTVEAGAVFNMFAIAAISSRQIIVNKYLQNNKGVNWNGPTVDDFVVVACVFGSVVEACVVHQS
ncbi:hypothetical protein TNCV_3536081 [Trichonephila clavipes]|uniref:Uncharacterized protein n=1 Tax=Trichonephila clavipes TaxID=2585209 RepID=A0A8X6VWQ4_TRICX|nr:hypothetical protein TNCV_3536081 [Trichonephila clavipes]